MKLLSALLLSSTLAMVAPNVWAQANTIPSQPHLLVKGSATRTVMPDRFTVKVALESVDPRTDVARQRLQGNNQRVIELFKRSGAIAGTVRADNLSIAPSTHYRDGEQVFEGTRVSRQLEAAFPTVEALQVFLGGLEASKEVQVRTAAPSYAGEATLRAALKGEAAAQTRASAKGLARAYGATVTGLYSISDVAPSFAYGVQAGSWPDARGTSDYSDARPMDSVEVTGSHSANAPGVTGELLTAAPITYTENVYAIFLIQDGP
ncbi:SIMPL domain-containing protein [Stenotrophomonas rhizophila]|uniref:SIMPL domain-containing protein n=1 Tax=Stenotrophomonas rhizophila TaxID=216778 RepID=UPI003CCFF492